MNSTERSDRSLMIRLSIMMFFQYFAMGAWYVSATGFMLRGDIRMDGLVFAVYSAGPLAAIISPFFIGLIADRFLPAQTTLAILFATSGVLLCVAPSLASPFAITDVADQHWLSGRFSVLWLSMKHPFVLTILLHMLCFMPTTALTVSLSFTHLKNRKREFPLVRVMGTVGWVCGNFAISLLPGQDASTLQFFLAGGCAVGLGFYCLSLPSTPPQLRGTHLSVTKIIGLDSLLLFRNPAFAVFVVAAFLMCIPQVGYTAFARSYVEAAQIAPLGSATFVLAFGQVSEMVFMLIVPFCFSRFGVKWMLTIGMAAWVARYTLFASAAESGSMWMIITGILLHGACYVFFFITGMIYVDSKSPAAIRNQAQGFFVLVTQGLGMFVGAQVFGGLEVHLTENGLIDWQRFWIAPAIFAAAVTIGFVLLFRDKACTSLS